MSRIRLKLLGKGWNKLNTHLGDEEDFINLLYIIQGKQKTLYTTFTT